MKDSFAIEQCKKLSKDLVSKVTMRLWKIIMAIESLLCRHLFFIG